MLEDQEILEKVAKGDRDAFNEIFRKYHRYLVSIAFSYTKDMDVSRDLSQEVFLDVWKRREKIDISTSFKGFIRRAVINQALTKQKQKKYHSQLSDVGEHIPSGSKAEHRVEYHELQETVQDIVLSLPERCAQVFRLSRYEGKSHKEIAAELNISTKTIENQMTKALKALRNGLQQAGLMAILIIIFILTRG